MALTNAALLSLTERNQGMRFHAFDSFEGLPTVSPDLAEGSSWVKGSMDMSEAEFLKTIERHGIFKERVKIYPGFFNSSLTEELKIHFIKNENRISFVNIDCDLYKSAVDVFNFIGPLLQNGALIYLDDWYCGYKGSENSGVARAFYEFSNSNDIRCVHFRDCGWWGKCFVVQENPTFVR